MSDLKDEYVKTLAASLWHFNQNFAFKHSGKPIEQLMVKCLDEQSQETQDLYLHISEYIHAWSEHHKIIRENSIIESETKES